MVRLLYLLTFSLGLFYLVTFKHNFLLKKVKKMHSYHPCIQGRQAAPMSNLCILLFLCLWQNVAADSFSNFIIIFFLETLDSERQKYDEDESEHFVETINN